VKDVVTLKAYFDTSVLLKLYNDENGSIEAYERARRFNVLPLTFLGEIELKNSLRILKGRGRIQAEELTKMLDCIDEDSATGRLFRLRPDPSALESYALKLSSNFAADHLCRSLDILHVAHACEAGIPTFITSDQRQAILAEKAGLEVDFIDLSQTTSPRPSC